MKKRITLIISMLLISLLVLSGCTSNKENELENNEVEVNDQDKKNENPIVTIEMADGEKIEIELYPNIAPNTVNNFVSLINNGYYDGLDFHRLIPGFMIQGGDPDGDGTGGPGYGIKGEFEKNGIANDIAHVRGVLSMARSGNPDSAGSQFFIMVADSPHLDGEYAGFGKVISGMEVVDKIVESETDGSDKPLKAQVMKQLTVDLKGEIYDQAEIIK